MARCPTDHSEVQFGSGDYYVFCHACGRKWAMMSHSQPEYGTDKDGKPIGADPLQCSNYFGETNIRVRPA